MRDDDRVTADVLRGLRARRRVPALAAVVVTADGGTHVAADGVADLATGRPADADTVFAWYSLTKVFTATDWLLELRRRGWTLDTRLVDVAPDVVPDARGEQRRRWEAVTLGQLPSHGAGFGDRQLHAAAWFVDEEQPWPDPEETLARVLARRAWLTRPPGAGFRYSNLGYAVMGQALAAWTGRPFREGLVERVLRPGGATRTGFVPPASVSEAGAATTATGHVRRWSRWGLLVRAVGGFRDGVASGPWDRVRRRRPVFSPHGGLWGPVGDLAPLLRRHLAASLDEDDPLHVLQHVHRPRTGRARRRGEGGLGWRVHAGPPPHVTHGGRGPGFTTEMAVVPAAGVAGAVLGNATFDAKAALDELLRPWTRDARSRVDPVR